MMPTESNSFSIHKKNYNTFDNNKNVKAISRYSNNKNKIIIILLLISLLIIMNKIIIKKLNDLSS